MSLFGDPLAQDESLHLLNGWLSFDTVVFLFEIVFFFYFYFHCNQKP